MHFTAEKDVPEIWGGIECTINRLENNFYDQLEINGFYLNDEQLKAIIELGIKTIRFPILWERHQPNAEKETDWTCTEQKLVLLQANGITPVAGLLHHGSGPAFTDLLQKDFPEKFAVYAGKVAAKFPWLTYYNPINEPLTTARFSGLYGLWYPHKNNDVSFIRMLLNELKAIVLAMQEIRKINPAAKLVQTEDLGKTYSTPLLSYQAVFENHRRWLTCDILTGKFDNSHPLWNYFMRLGIEKEKLQFFICHPCVPDIIGVNHYITSERYLDEQTQNYPAGANGGNAIHQYADVEAVRVPLKEPHGLSILLAEIWERYHLPLAVTEAHLHCTREEQIRWLKHVYDTALALKLTGMDIRAVTSWALLGSYGWNKLLTAFPGEYETGAFDISAGKVRPTAVATVISDLLMQKNTLENIISPAGWWNSAGNFTEEANSGIRPKKKITVRPIVITGKRGTLGQAFEKICAHRNLSCLLLDRQEADICNAMQLESVIQRYQPWAIINTAGFVDIDKAEKERDLCYRENTRGVQELAVICEKHKIKLLTFSSDQVFDGLTNMPYCENGTTNPVNVYGRSKQLAESFLSTTNPSALMVRSSAFFGPWDEYNFLSKMTMTLSSGNVFYADDDLTVSPTYVPHLVHASLDLLIDDAAGIWHLVNKGSVTWYEFAKAAAVQAGLNAELIIPAYRRKAVAKRPVFSALASEKYSLMPTLQAGIEQYLKNKKTAIYSYITK